jgi:hypothetical protein
MRSIAVSLSGLGAVLTAFLAASLVTLIGTPTARASLVQAMDVGELARRSDHITVADVVSVRSAWDDEHRKIYTTVELQVVESWKGDDAPASRITVVQPGGTVGDISMVVFGLSRFVPGERALLFLRGSPAQAGVVGLTQGKRPMRRDTATGSWLVDAPDRSGVKLVMPAPTNRTPAPIDYRSRPLDEMRTEIKRMVGTGR